MEQELQPLSVVLAEIEKKIAAGDPIPDFGTLAAWAAGEAERMGSPAAKRSGKRPDAAEISIKIEGETLFSFRELSEKHALSPDEELFLLSPGPCRYSSSQDTCHVNQTSSRITTIYLLHRQAANAAVVVQ